MVKIIEKVKSGYTGGHVENPSYEDVLKGDTGHCINSASLEFIPKKEMEERGYGDFLKYI